MLLYSTTHMRLAREKPVRSVTQEHWHPDDQVALYNDRLRVGEQIRSLAHWLGAEADKVSDVSLYEVPPTVAHDNFFWGGIDMENPS